MDAVDEPVVVGEGTQAAGPTTKQRRIIWAALTALAATSLFGVAALVFYGFITLLAWSYSILLPIGLAVIVALVLDPVVALFEKRGMRRSRATLLVCLLAVLGFLLFWAFLGNTIYSEASGFFKDLPGSIAKLQGTVSESPTSEPAPLPAPGAATNAAAALPATNAPTTSGTNAPPVAPVSVAASPRDKKSSSRHSAIIAWLKGNLPAVQQAVEKNIGRLAGSALGPVGQALGFILGFGFVPIYVYYFLADQERIANHWQDYVPIRPSRLRDEVISVLTEINTSLISYFRGQIIVAGCNGVFTFIGLWLIGIPYSVVLGIITGALSIVPFLGIIASILPALLLGYLSAQNDPTMQWLRPLLVLLVFSVVQMFESMLITPRVQSHSTGLHPLTIILGILFWSLLLPGLLGPVVAVPLTCAVVVLMRRYVWVGKKAKTV